MSSGWYAEPGERGATLVELLVGLAAGLLVLAVALTAVAALGRLVNLEALLLRQHEQVDVLAPLLVAWVSGAGCGRRDPAAALLVSASQVTMEADVDGLEGFPDGNLDGAFESVTLAAARGSFRIESGGGAAQPAADAVAGALFEQAAPHLLRVELRLAGRVVGLEERRLELWICMPNLEPSGSSGQERREADAGLPGDIGTGEDDRG
ncbi:MAG: hypothetical protein Kow00109_19650 [Acidobacteriota bacterium]